MIPIVSRGVFKIGPIGVYPGTAKGASPLVPSCTIRTPFQPGQRLVSWDVAILGQAPRNNRVYFSNCSLAGPHRLRSAPSAQPGRFLLYSSFKTPLAISF